MTIMVIVKYLAVSILGPNSQVKNNFLSFQFSALREKLKLGMMCKLNATQAHMLGPVWTRLTQSDRSKISRIDTTVQGTMDNLTIWLYLKQQLVISLLFSVTARTYQIFLKEK